MTATGVFTIFGAVMGLVAGISLTIHGALLDNLLAVNPIERV